MNIAIANSFLTDAHFTPATAFDMPFALQQPSSFSLCFSVFFHLFTGSPSTAAIGASLPTIPKRVCAGIRPIMTSLAQFNEVIRVRG
jgi:hypothetical protein